MLYETIKHALNATVQAHGLQSKNFPITVTLVHGSTQLVVRVSDQGSLARVHRQTLLSLLAYSVCLAGGVQPWGGLPSSVASSSAQPALTSQRLDIFSFSHMRRLHLHSPSTGILGALKTMGTLSGTVSEQINGMDSGIGLPLAKMFAEYFGGGLEMNTTLGFGSDSFLSVAKLGLVST